MHKFIQPMATIMIVLLLVILIWVFLSYYKGYEKIETMQPVSGEMNVSNSNHSTDNLQKPNYENVVSSIISNLSGDKEEDPINGKSSNHLDEKSGDRMPRESGDSRDSRTDELSTMPNVTIELPEDKQKPNEIISSNTETSSQEKQEVLTEIDEALKGLLEAVGKVEIVDETRLDATLRQEVETP